MTIQLTNGGIQFNDGSQQNTAYSSAVNDKGSLITINSYVTAGTFTWNRPAGCTKILVKVVGGGGGGAGYCESGGAGGYAEKLIDVTSVPSVSLTVGGGGAGVVYYAVGGTGGTSSFGSYCFAYGGYGANYPVAHSGGIGGYGVGGDVNLTGGSGTGHVDGGGGYRSALAQGGIGRYGSGYQTTHYANVGAVGSSAPGAGGAGAPAATAAAWTGAYGMSGIIIVYCYT